MAYKYVAITDHIIKMTFMGNFDDDDADQHVIDMDPYLNRATADNPLNFIIDAHQMGKISARARRVFTQRNGDPRIGNTAVLGANRFLRVLATFILKASGRDNVRFFDSETEALTWIQQQQEKVA